MKINKNIFVELIAAVTLCFPNGSGCAGMINSAQYSKADALVIIFEISGYFSVRGKR